MTKEIEIYERDGGFLAGRELKDGRMSADAHRITEQEILTMFAATMTDHCQRHNTDKMIFHDGDGNIYVAVKTKAGVIAETKD